MNKQPSLTEFTVTETYIIKAQTGAEALQMVDNDDFSHGLESHNVKIEVNF